MKTALLADDWRRRHAFIITLVARECFTLSSSKVGTAIGIIGHLLLLSASLQDAELATYRPLLHGACPMPPMTPHSFS